MAEFRPVQIGKAWEKMCGEKNSEGLDTKSKSMRWQGYEAQRKAKTRYGKDRYCSARKSVALIRKSKERNCVEWKSNGVDWKRKDRSRHEKAKS